MRELILVGFDYPILINNAVMTALQYYLEDPHTNVIIIIILIIIIIIIYSKIRQTVVKGINTKIRNYSGFQFAG